MPNEADMRFKDGGWQIYMEGQWWWVDPSDPEMAAIIAELEAGPPLKKFGESEMRRQVEEEATEVRRRAAEGTERTEATEAGLLGLEATRVAEREAIARRPPDWPAGKPWPPMKEETILDENGRPAGKRQVVDEAAIASAYRTYGDPYAAEKPEEERFTTFAEADTAAAKKEAETGLFFDVAYDSKNKALPFSLKQVAAPKEEKFAGFKTREEAQARAAELGPGATAVYDPGSDRWYAQEQEPQAAPPGGWPGREQAAPRQQSIEQLITDALVLGDTDRALALDDFRQRPSAFQLAQFAQSLATTPEDFLKIYQALQDAQAKSFEALGAGGQGFAGAVSPNQAAQIVERLATGQFGAAPPTVPGLPTEGPFAMPTPPPGIGAGFAQTTASLEAQGFNTDLYYTDPGYRAAVDMALAERQAQQAAGGLFGKKPGEPGFEAQQAMEFAQKIGGQGVQALPEGKGFVTDISNLTPAQVQSQFGSLAGPSQSDIEDMTFEQLAASGLSAQQKEFWRRRKQARVGAPVGGFAQTVAASMRPKPTRPTVPVTVFRR